MTLDIQWERNDYSRVPYRRYHDPEVIDTESVGSLFAVGAHLDEIVFVDGQPRFESKTVILDNPCVPHAMSTPL